jgi:hypothetical protein
MLSIETQSTEYIFYWAGEESELPTSGAETGTAEIAFGSEAQALQFLRRFPGLFEFRTLLQQRNPGLVYRWRNEDILGKVAECLIERRLLVMKRWRQATVSQPSASGAAGAVKVARREVESAEPAEPPTFLNNHDGDAQAQTLIEAAEHGTPFCEECPKASRQAA